MGGSLLHVITTTDRRGAEVSGVDLGHALARRGWTVRTVALVNSGRSTRLDVPTLGRTRLGVHTLAALRREARAVDLVVAHGSTTLPACALALLGTRAPFVYRNIGDPSQWSTTTFRRIRTAGFLRRARVTVALTAATAEEIVRRYGVDPSHVAVIPRGVPAERFPMIDADARRTARRRLGIPETAAVVIYLGSLSSEKNVGTAIDAVASMANVELVVVGDGPDRSSLEELAVRLGSDRIRFLGQTDDPAGALAAADVVVLPSTTEGLPGVLIEAGLSGLPAVATDVGYVGEIVVDRVTGFLVPPGDSASMALRIADALAQARDLGRAARERCLERFELEVVASAWDRLLTRFIERDS